MSSISGEPSRTISISSTATASPSTPTSSPAGNATTAEPILPGAAPTFVTDDAVTYSNITIDDFSPVITYSRLEQGGDWLSPLTDSDMSAVRPAPQRDWHLGTYRRTETRNATIRIEFWGSEIYLYGDTGPMYGAYSLQVDELTPVLGTAYVPARAGPGPAHLLHSLKNLTDERHELLITNLGTREGLNDGNSFLLDYVLVKQQLGPLNGNSQPALSDIEGTQLANVNKTGTWSLTSIDQDVITTSGENADQPKTFYSTQENGASITHSFNNATAVQVYGTRNSTHGQYRATLSTSSAGSPLVSETYNASVPCGDSGDDAIAVPCEWTGSVLKFAAANLLPNTSYVLKLENVDANNKTFDVDLIRTFGAVGQGWPGSSGGGSSGSSSDPDNTPASGALTTRGVDVGPQLALFLVGWFVLWRNVFGRL